MSVMFLENLGSLRDIEDRRHSSLLTGSDKGLHLGLQRSQLHDLVGKVVAK